MINEKYHFYDKQVVIESNRGICQDSEELIKSGLFRKVLQKYLKYLKKKDSPLLGIFKDISESIQEEFILNSFFYYVKIVA